jgi:thiol-disulfide isomerase/thioredoxin
LSLLAVCICAFAAPAALALEAGQTAPAFSLPRKGGGTVSLADFQGQVVYLDFWASWCGPCRESFPWMNELQSRYGVLGLKVVAINVDAKQSDAEAFLEQFPHTSFTVAFDAKGTAPGLYAIKGMPTSFLIGPDGKVLMVHTGFKHSDRDELQVKVLTALNAAIAARAASRR